MKRTLKAGMILPVAFGAAIGWTSAGLLAPLHAQNFSIEWYKITAGAGVSTNSQFNLTGTAGQHDAHHTVSGGHYSLTGGFWSFVVAVPTPGAPELTIALTSSPKAVISWPAPSTGFVLQQNSTLSPATWAEVTDPVTSLPGVNQIEVPLMQGQTFYRLIHR